MTAEQQAHQQAVDSATALWKQYGGKVPFQQWINSQVAKARKSGLWKPGMTIEQIFQLNQGVEDEQLPQPPYLQGASKFTIAGMNGYAVLGASVVILAGLIYLVVRKIDKAS
jgi:hypothetical protein